MIVRRHGRGGYVRGCRCTVCVQANRDYQRECPLAEADLRAFTFDRASELIDALKAGSYKPDEWDCPF